MPSSSKTPVLGSGTLLGFFVAVAVVVVVSVVVVVVMVCA